MRDGVRPGAGRRRLLRREDEPPANDEFLFHLSRGSELLMQSRVVEAKEELERALSHRPQDAQSQDLLAGVYFRLGVYPTAIRIWQTLVEDFPDDVVLHVNLGLSLFKTGQPEDARDHLERALDLDPEHDRAWGYYGLVLWRLGRLDAAREAFLRGGQATMALRMEEMSSAGEVEAPRPSAMPPAPEPREDPEVQAMRDAADEAGQRVVEEAALRLESDRPRRTTGQWQVVETGASAVPRRRRTTARMALTNPRVDAVASSWTVGLPEGTALAVGPEGELLARSEGAVFARLSGLRAARGPLVTQPVDRRFRGRDREEILGGADPILRWEPPVGAVFTPGEGQRFHALLVDESQLFVREELLHAFDHRVGWESGRVPVPGADMTLVSFHGEGNVALLLPRRPAGVEVSEGEEVMIDPRALVGWTGRLFPRAVERPDPAALTLAFRGNGILLVA